MTKEEAIQILADLIDSPFLHTWEKQNKALHMAIEVLSKPIVDITQRDLCEDISCTDCPFMKETCKLMDYVAYAEAVQGWIPCSERLPEDLEAVNVTWVNHNPPVYYQYTKDVPNADTAVYYRGVWYWWDSTICDVLGEYGEKCGAEQIDKDIEILAWMPLPTPYKGGDDK